MHFLGTGCLLGLIFVLGLKLWPRKASEMLILFCLICCSVTKSCLALCNPVNCSTPGFPVLHYLSESPQIHVHWVSDAIQSSHLLSSPSPLALIFSQHQDLFQWVSSSHQVAKVLEFQLPMNIQGWFPLGLTDLISLLSKGLSRVFSSTTVLQNHQVFKEC